MNFYKNVNVMCFLLSAPDPADIGMLADRMATRRRDRSPISSSDTASESSETQSQSRIRQNEMLMGSYSDLLAERSRFRARHALGNTRQRTSGLRYPGRSGASVGSSLSSEGLLNPRVDPWLPLDPDQSVTRSPLLEIDLSVDNDSDSGLITDRMSGVGTNSGVQENSLSIDTTGVTSTGSVPVGVSDMSSAEHSLYSNVTSEGSRNGGLYCITSSLSGMISSTNGASSTRRPVCAKPSAVASATALGEAHTGPLLLQSSTTSSATVTPNVLSSTGAGSNRGTLGSTPSATVISSAPPPTSLLSGFLRQQQQQPTSQQYGSIRDRLQTSIPLSCDPVSSQSRGPVRVLSATNASSTIPQVTIISQHDPNNTSTATDSGNSRNVLGSYAVEQPSSFGQFSSRLLSRLVHRWDNTQTTASSDSDSRSIGNQSGESTHVSTNMETASGASTVNDTSHTLRSGFPRLASGNVGSGRYCGGTEPRWRSRLTSAVRSYPYALQNRTRRLHPITVPNSTGTQTGTQTSQHSQTPTRDTQAFSDTENEVSNHLTRSGAYFMPISADPLRARSSTSTGSCSSTRGSSDPTLSSAETLPDVPAGQRSRSQTQGQEVELMVDQNDNYSASQIPNANLPSNSEIRHETQDSNNNSIHIVHSSTATIPTSRTHNTDSSVLSTSPQPVDSLPSVISTPVSCLSAVGVTSVPVVPSSISTLSTATSVLPASTLPTSQPTDQDYVTLRNTFFNMTSQIEQEMSDLNRRINALRESFNESLLALRQDRQRYESLGSLIEVAATTLETASTVYQSAQETQASGSFTAVRPREQINRETPEIFNSKCAVTVLRFIARQARQQKPPYLSVLQYFCIQH